MTLCIAQKCQHAGEPRVVCCFDAQVGSDYEASDSAYKFKVLSKQAVAMFAGPLVAAEDLISDYAAYLSTRTLTRETYREELWEPMKANLSKLTEQEEYIHGAGDSPQVLVVLSLDGRFRLISIDQHGISEAPFFAAIGTGADSALSMLRWRKTSSDTSMNSAIYCAYEAKRFGEVSPHVGKFTYIHVVCSLVDSLTLKIVNASGVTRLAEAFGRFGPQLVDRYWHLQSEDII